MIRSRSLLALLAALAMVGYFSETASAQSVAPQSTQGFPYPGWIGYYASPYSLGQIPVPPYFALHPPVYYSAPVPRSYGYSPYAYSGDTRTPDVVQPQVIDNPHVEPKETVQRIGTKTVSAQVILNPFVSQAVTGSETVAVRD